MSHVDRQSEQPRQPSRLPLHVKIGSAALVFALVACGSSQRLVPTPTPKFNLHIAVDCGDLPVEGLFVHSLTDGGQEHGAFAGWEADPANPDKAEADITLPITTTAAAADGGCGGSRTIWANNYHSNYQPIQPGDSLTATFPGSHGGVPTSVGDNGTHNYYGDYTTVNGPDGTPGAAAPLGADLVAERREV